MNLDNLSETEIVGYKEILEDFQEEINLFSKTLYDMKLVDELIIFDIREIVDFNTVDFKKDLFVETISIEGKSETKYNKVIGSLSFISGNIVPNINFKQNTAFYFLNFLAHNTIKKDLQKVLEMYSSHVTMNQKKWDNDWELIREVERPNIYIYDTTSGKNLISASFSMTYRFTFRALSSNDCFLKMDNQIIPVITFSQETKKNSLAATFVGETNVTSANTDRHIVISVQSIFQKNSLSEEYFEEVNTESVENVTPEDINKEIDKLSGKRYNGFFIPRFFLGYSVSVVSDNEFYLSLSGDETLDNYYYIAIKNHDLEESKNVTLTFKYTFDGNITEHSINIEVTKYNVFEEIINDLTISQQLNKGYQVQTKIGNRPPFNMIMNIESGSIQYSSGEYVQIEFLLVEKAIDVIR